MLYSLENHAIQFETQLSDESLMTAICKGNQTALGELYQRHAAHLRAIVFNVLRDDGLADDLVQEIFMEVWRIADRFSAEKGKALGWLVTLSKRRAIDRLRRISVVRRAEEKLQEQETQGTEAMRHTVENDYAANDMHEIVRRIVDKLPEAQKQAIHLAYFQGMSQREIANHTSIPLGTIKTRLELGLRKVGAALREVIAEPGLPAQAA
ncbi:MAG: sigma-70 family RNA polymerase sigma factor [Chthoniobacteraceae bacterium]